MGDYVNFSRDPGLWEELTQTLWGSHIGPSLSQFQVKDVTQSELLALSHAGAWVDAEKPQHDMAYLLIALGKTVEGRDGIWASCGVGTPTPSIPLLLRCEETHPTH